MWAYAVGSVKYLGLSTQRYMQEFQMWQFSHWPDRRNNQACNIEKSAKSVPIGLQRRKDRASTQQQGTVDHVLH